MTINDDRGDWYGTRHELARRCRFPGCDEYRAERSPACPAHAPLVAASLTHPLVTVPDDGGRGMPEPPDPADLASYIPGGLHDPSDWSL